MYFSESGIWLGKILASAIQFANFTKVSPTKILCYTVINNQGLNTYLVENYLTSHQTCLLSMPFKC